MMSRTQLKAARGPFTEATSGATDARVNRRSRKVRALYTIGSARWYDLFRRAWTWLTSRRAEEHFDRLTEAAVFKGSCVLDVGCGTGYNLGRLGRLELPFSSYLGVDLTPAMLAIARNEFADEARAEFAEMDLHDLGTTEQRFDVVLCTWVVSHLADPRAAFELAYKLLATGGRALFLVMSEPRRSVRWWFAPLARIFRAQVVSPAVFDGLPGAVRLTRFTFGLVTLVELTKDQE